MTGFPESDDILKFMNRAAELSEEAGKKGEVPVGCVIVRDGEIIAEGMNSSEENVNSLKHAEMAALEKAIEKTGKRILPDCDIYVTLEPCPMCAGAIKNAMIKRVFFGAYDRENGACLSKWNILPEKTDVFGGIEGDRCAEIISDFFRKIRRGNEK